MRRSFTRFPGGLKLPMDTYLHAYKREVNQNSLLTALNSKNFPGGACPHTHLASVYTLMYALGGKLDQCNFASTGPAFAYLSRHTDVINMTKWTGPLPSISVMPIGVDRIS